MRRSLLVGLGAVFALLALAATAGASWPQAGHDAARTGHVPTAGPAWNDTAFVTQLSGEPSFLGDFPSRPRIADGNVYVPVGLNSDEDTSGIARVELDTGEAEMLVETDYDPQATAISDGRIFVLRSGGMAAYELGSGERLWQVDHPSFAPEPAGSVCLEPAVVDGRVVVPCTEVDTAAGTTGLVSPNAPGAWYPFVWAVDADAGETVWAQPLNRTEAEDPSTTSQDLQDARPGADGIRLALGVSVVDGNVVSTTIDQFFRGFGCVPNTDVCPEASHQRTRFTLWGLDAGGGSLAWWNSTEVVRTQAGGDDRGPFSEALPATSFEPTGGEGVLFTKFDGKVQQLNPAQGGEVLWEDPLGQEDARAGLSGAGSALTDEAVYVSSLQSVSKYSLGPPAPSIDWQFRLDSTQAVFTGTLLAAEENLYLVHGDASTNATVLAVNTTSGEATWDHEIGLASDEKQQRPAFPFTYVVADGVLVAVGEDGTVHAIGETEASLGGPDLDTERYPEVGETVTVDASDTEPGAFGEATRYMVDWGDGTVSGWQASPTFTHTYEEEGTHQAHVFAGNDANQTSSTAVAMRVGQEEPTWLSERFAEGNQDMTFGVIGIALALGGGAIGVARRRRKRSNLEDELEALEEGFAELEDKPSECEAFLDERKARARSLAIDGYLEEDQVGILENRAEELRGQLRTGLLDERFQFLPHGMVQSLKRMLEDGQINAWERDTIETLLEEDEALNAAQKERVRGLLERWSASGGPDGGGSS